MKWRRRDILKLLGNLSLTVADGSRIYQIKQQNLVVDIGLDFARDLLAGVVTTPLSHFAYGTDATAAAAGQTTLFAEVFRSAITQYDTSVPKRLVVKHYLSSTQANGNTIREAGLFNAASTGTMYARAVLSSAVAKSIAVTITAEWTIDLSS